MPSVFRAAVELGMAMGAPRDAAFE